MASTKLLCRCCLLRTPDKNLKVQYTTSERTEVYNDMLKNCFNIHLTVGTQPGDCGICMKCIERLRDANDFKKQVENCSIQFEMLAKEMKETADEDELEKPTLNLDSDHDETCDADFMETQSIIDVSDDKDDDVDDVDDDWKLPNSAPRQNSEYDVQYDKKVIELWQSRPRKKSKEEILALITTIRTLIEFSNITVFNRTKRKLDFGCFYCSETFVHLIELREHQTKSHKKTEAIKILNTMKHYTVSAEITDLKCTLCEESMLSLNELKTHLVDVHEKKFNLELGDRVIPFKAPEKNLYQCQVCSDSFETFVAIDQHMDVHYNNYVCKDCGAGYAFRWRLDTHRQSHRKGCFTCDQCAKTFTFMYTLTEHMKYVHKNLKRFACPQCPERFHSDFQRLTHLYRAHGVPKRSYPCKVCGRALKDRSDLRRHMNLWHNKKKDQHCEKCSFIGVTKYDLKVHMETHTGVKRFVCSLCDKTFASKSYLRKHIERHASDKDEYVCDVCEEMFRYKHGLTRHINAEHSNKLMNQ